MPPSSLATVATGQRRCGWIGRSKGAQTRSLVAAAYARTPCPPGSFTLIAPKKGTGDEREAISPASGEILKVLEGWAKAIPARAKYSPRAACWYVAEMMAWYHSG